MIKCQWHVTLTFDLQAYFHTLKDLYSVGQARVDCKNSTWCVFSLSLLCLGCMWCFVFGCQYQCNWLPGKTRLWNDLLCVKWDVKHSTVGKFNVQGLCSFRTWGLIANCSTTVCRLIVIISYLVLDCVCHCISVYTNSSIVALLIHSLVLLTCDYCSIVIELDR